MKSFICIRNSGFIGALALFAMFSGFSASATGGDVALGCSFDARAHADGVFEATLTYEFDNHGSAELHNVYLILADSGTAMMAPRLVHLGHVPVGGRAIGTTQAVWLPQSADTFQPENVLVEYDGSDKRRQRVELSASGCPGLVEEVLP